MDGQGKGILKGQNNSGQRQAQSEMKTWPRLFVPEIAPRTCYFKPVCSLRGQKVLPRVALTPGIWSGHGATGTGVEKTFTKLLPGLSCWH